jgi:hypothetical protein
VLISSVCWRCRSNRSCAYASTRARSASLCSRSVSARISKENFDLVPRFTGAVAEGFREFASGLPFWRLLTFSLLALRDLFFRIRLLGGDVGRKAAFALAFAVVG